MSDNDRVQHKHLKIAMNKSKQYYDEKMNLIYSELSSKNNTLDSQVKDKANETDLDIERKRIDSFVKLEEGSTTGDAELIDGRIGEDGITYENIGGAIRNQINKINQQLLKENINFNIKGNYVNSEGEQTPLGGWYMSDFIKVNKGDIVQVTTKGYESNVSAIYLYNNSKGKVKPLQISDNTLQTYTVIVDQDGFIRCSGDHKVTLKGSILRINPQVTNNYNEYNNNFSLDISLNNWTNGGFIKFKDGTVESHSKYSYTDYIDIYGLEGLYVYVTAYYEFLTGFAFYDDNKKYIGGIGLEKNEENPNMGQLKEIQLKGHYMRLTCRTEYVDKFKLYTSIKQVVKSICSMKKLLDLDFKYDWTAGSYIRYTDGEVIKISNKYSYTDYIDISNNTNLYVYITEYYDYLSGIAFYDKDKKYISGIGADINGENPNMGQLKEIQLKGHYMRLTCRTSFLSSFKLYTSIKQVVKSFHYKEFVNPCFYSENLNLIKMFNKIMCIGDSYTEGAIEYKTSDGRKLQSIEKIYSYPTQLSKIANVETVNLGHAGYTTTQWYNKYKDTDLSGYDCAIIFLGINDWYQNNETLDTESYTNIINKVRSNNKNIPIFCVTITKNYLTTAYTLNNKIKEVALNNNCYIIDLGEYSDWDVGSKWLNGSHPNAYGYYHNAEMINSYINYIIENNKANFYNLSFVGTDKIDF